MDILESCICVGIGSISILTLAKQTQLLQTRWLLCAFTKQTRSNEVKHICAFT